MRTRRCHGKRTVSASSAPRWALASPEESRGSRGSKGPPRGQQKPGTGRCSLGAFRPRADPDVKDAFRRGTRKGVCVAVAPADLRQQLLPLFFTPTQRPVVLGSFLQPDAIRTVTPRLEGLCRLTARRWLRASGPAAAPPACAARL